MNFRILSLIALNMCLMSQLHASPEGRLDTPYKVCQDMLIVDEEAYKKNHAEWDKFADKCQQTLLATPDVDTSDIFSILNHVKYKDFALKVATEVKKNLARQKNYYECTAKCFEGGTSCKEGTEVIKCSDRKKELLDKLAVDARRARIQLALTRSSSDLFDINPNNIMTLTEDQRINKDLKEFELIGPISVGLSKLTDREIKEAKRRLKADDEAVKKEAKERGLLDNKQYVAVNLYRKTEEHQRLYHDIVYAQAPILSMIDRPEEFIDGVPKWSDKSLAKAANDLVRHAKSTQEMVDMSIKSEELEFSRQNGDAVRFGIISRLPGTTPRKELLFYLGMKGAVEEVLKKNPADCGLATTMYKRLVAKDTQMAYLSGAVSVAPLVLGFAGKFVQGAGKAAAAISAVQSNWVVGIGMAAAFPIESSIKLNSTVKEAAMGLRTGEEVHQARSQLKLATAMTFVNAAALISRNANAINAFESAVKKSKYATALRNAPAGIAGQQHIVNQWMSDKIDHAVNAKVLTANEVLRLKEKASIEMMDHLAIKIQSTHPDFFKNDKNMDFFLKSVSIATNKKAGDPIDLAAKMQDMLVDVNIEAISKWNPKATKGLLVVVENSMSELRAAFRKDPATYAKFTTDPAARQKIFSQALRRSGVSEERVRAMTKCALPGR